MGPESFVLALAAAALGGGAGWQLATNRARARFLALSSSAPVPARTARREAPPGASRETGAMPLEETLDLLPDPVLLLDMNGTARFRNAEAFATFGDTTGIITRHPEVYAALGRLKEEYTVTADFVLDVPVRRAIRATLRVLPAPTASGGRILAILADRTEQDAVERVRADFVAYASHELRTPLAALIGFIETLRGPAADDPAAQRQFLEIMAGQAGRMQRLIDQLLALSRVEMMEHRKPRGVIEAAQVVARVRDEMAPLLEARNVRMQVEPQSLTCPGDSDQIVQVLLNLVENAMKYAGGTPTRPGQIILSVLPAPAGGRWGTKPGILFTVTDDGPGISPHHLPRLTERFYRVENSAAAIPGSGLGLAIVRHIIDRHDGRLVIESDVGSGTRCMVWLPTQPERRVSRERPSLLLS